MQTIHVKPDNLDERNAEFAQVPLDQPLFLNSLPKSGSHLLRNIIRMFVPVEHHYTADFIQFANLKRHVAAFDGPPAKLSWGHLFFADISAATTGGARRILLVRDPYDWVLAMARFMLSDEFSGDLDILKRAPLTAEELMNVVIFGLPRQSPGLHETFLFNAVAWLGTGEYLVRFEELRDAVKNIDSEESEAYFAQLLEACGITMPDDWRERVRIGADPAQSGTARQNLTMRGVTIPDSLPQAQRDIVDLVSPRLRSILGYAK